MRPPTRRFLTIRQLWVLLIVPAMLSAVFAAAAVASAPAPPARTSLTRIAAPTRVPVALAAGRAQPTPAVITAPGAAGAPTLAAPTLAAPTLTRPIIRGGGGPTELHLRKVVRNEGGGTATVADWMLHAAGEAVTLSGTSPVDSEPDFPPGVYTLSETYVGTDPEAAGRYVASGWTCVDNATRQPVDVSPEGVFVIYPGDDLTCTITNAYRWVTAPPRGIKIVGRKLYAAREGPYKDGPVGLPGWRITATLVGVETAVRETTTDALGQYVFTQDVLGEMVFPGATIRLCEEDRPGWRHVTPACVNVTLPNPLPPAFTATAPDFVNAQEKRGPAR